MVEFTHAEENWLHEDAHAHSLPLHSGFDAPTFLSLPEGVHSI